MKHLYIIGARGCGRETYGLFKECESLLGDIECSGFLDDNKEGLDDFEGYPPIVSSVEEYIPKVDDVFVCALGDPKWIKHYTSIIEGKGGKFISIISPLASIGQNSIVGDGCIINKYALISSDVKLGNHVYMGVFTDFGHDVVVGDYCHIGAYTFLGGGVHIEDCVTAHPRVNVLPHKKIGEGATLGASSVVIRNVAAGITVFGIPAKKI